MLRPARTRPDVARPHRWPATGSGRPRRARPDAGEGLLAKLVAAVAALVLGSSVLVGVPAVGGTVGSGTRDVACGILAQLTQAPACADDTAPVAAPKGGKPDREGPNHLRRQADECLRGAGDLVQGIGQVSLDVLAQLLSTKLEVRPAGEAVGPAVAEAQAFLRNPFGIREARENPARFLCQTLVGIVAERGTGALRGVRVGTGAGASRRLLVDMCDGGPACLRGTRPGGRPPGQGAVRPGDTPDGPVAGAATGSERTGWARPKKVPRGFRPDGTAPRNSGRAVLGQGAGTSTCGATCLGMVADEFGTPVDLEDLVRQTPEEGVTMKTLAAMARRVGMPARPVQAGLERLKQATADGNPAIAVIEDRVDTAGNLLPVGEGIPHAVVVDGFTELHGQRVVAIRNPYGNAAGTGAQYYLLERIFADQFMNSFVEF